jgi:hypothetical protein
MFNWEELKENNTLEDFYNILCRNKPHKNSKEYKEWDYLESIAYEELLNDNENIKECNEIIDSIIEYLKKEKMEALKNYDL